MRIYVYVRVYALECVKGEVKWWQYMTFSLPFWCHSLFGSSYTGETRTFSSMFSFFPDILVQMEQGWVFGFFSHSFSFN